MPLTKQDVAYKGQSTLTVLNFELFNFPHIHVIL